MSDKNNIHNIQPDTWLASLVGALYFLVTGLILIQNEIPMEWSIPTWFRTIDTLFFFGLVVPAIGFAAGWALGFPRWSYPYTGGLLAYSLYMTNASTPLLYRLTGDMQAWGWRAWVPFLLAAATGATISWISRSRSTPPRPSTGSEPQVRVDSPLPQVGEGQAAVSAAGVRAFFSNLRQDPSLATYAMFAWMPLIILFSFDEMARLYSLVYMLLLTAGMVVTALLYQRARSRKSRSLFLAGGLLLTLILTEIGTIAYWLPLHGVDTPRALAFGIFIAVVMLYPFWLAHLFPPDQEGVTP